MKNDIAPYLSRFQKLNTHVKVLVALCCTWMILLAGFAAFQLLANSENRNRLASAATATSAEASSQTTIVVEPAATATVETNPVETTPVATNSVDSIEIDEFLQTDGLFAPTPTLTSAARQSEPQPVTTPQATADLTPTTEPVANTENAASTDEPVIPLHKAEKPAAAEIQFATSEPASITVPAASVTNVYQELPMLDDESTDILDATPPVTQTSAKPAANKVPDTELSLDELFGVEADPPASTDINVLDEIEEPLFIAEDVEFPAVDSPVDNPFVTPVAYARHAPEQDLAPSAENLAEPKQLTSADEWVHSLDGGPKTFADATSDTYADSPYSDHSQGYCPNCHKQHSWQVLPDGILFKSYLAGPNEPRMGSAWLYSKDLGWVWDITTGGRVGLIRHGTQGAVRPEGWQLDIEGAANPLLRTDKESDLDSVDFRFGLPLTWARGPLQMKFGYYHMSAHVGDEFLARNPGFVRDNYVRDALAYGVRVFVTDDFRVYGEVAYAFNADGGAEPWEFQFGTEYSPAGSNGRRPSPFWAVNVHLLEEHSFGGNLNAMAGWQWRGATSDNLFRFGAQYFNGKSSQFAFFDDSRQQYGLGIWYDF